MTVVTEKESLFHNPPEAGTELATREVSPMALLQDAVREGMSPDQLAVLVSLQRDMAEDSAKRAYAAAMAACQKEMPTVVADGLNPDTNRKYPRFETIQETAKPIYTAHGFALTFTDDNCPRGDGWKRTVCDCRHRDGHVTHHFIDMPIDGVTAKGNPISKMNPVQGCVSTNSYAQRVLTCNIFNITIAGKDQDGRPQNGPPVSEAQIATLHEWIEKIGADPQKVLAWREVKSFIELTTRDFTEMMASFKRKAADLGIK